MTLVTVTIYIHLHVYGIQCRCLDSIICRGKTTLPLCVVVLNPCMGCIAPYNYITTVIYTCFIAMFSWFGYSMTVHPARNGFTPI